MMEIVLGPPGCGKTTTLLGEVEKELERGTHPDRIGFVTFTRKGADEAIKRACTRFKLQPSQLRNFRTLHSLCYRALQVQASQVLVGKALFEFADHAGIEVTGRSWSDDGMLSGFATGDRALFMENLARIRRIPLRDQFDYYPDGLEWNYVNRVARTLEDFKQRRGLLDYTDMLNQFVAEDRDLGLTKLFVDEAQDLSALQWDVVRLLARSCERVVVAGDDDQAIYQWAGADVDQFVDMPGHSRVLGQSYRCPPAVQNIADGIIEGVMHRRPKKWNARRGAEGVVDTATGFREVALEDAGTALVLARNTYVLQQQVEPVLRGAGIVYEIAGKPSIDPDAVTAAATWEDLRKGDAITLGEARRMYKFIAANTGVKKGYKTLPTYGEDDDMPVTMTDLLETGGLRVDPALPWHEALGRLPMSEMTYMRAARRRGERLRGGKPRVKLSTIHSAKGGEADHVVLMGEMAARTYNEIQHNPDEERRVWYVGVTRAKERLTMVSSATKRDCPWL